MTTSAKRPLLLGLAALGLALANLARASEGPGSFKAELDAVAAFLPNEPELAGLSVRQRIDRCASVCCQRLPAARDC